MIIIFIRAVHKHSSFLSKHLVVLHFPIQFEFRYIQINSCSQMMASYMEHLQTGASIILSPWTTSGNNPECVC